jgi:hypothetical protein
VELPESTKKHFGFVRLWFNSNQTLLRVQKGLKLHFYAKQCIYQ